MSKNKKVDVIFEKYYEGIRNWIDISDIPEEFLKPEYKIDIEKTPQAYYSDSSHDDYTTLRIINYRDFTEEEKNKIRKELEVIANNNKEARRQSYLKLKQEFEND